MNLYIYCIFLWCSFT